MGKRPGNLERTPYQKEFQILVESLQFQDRQAFLDRIGHPLDNTFRFNPLKHETSFQHWLLEKQGFAFRRIASSLEAYRLESGKGIGKSLSHFMGHLYLQDLGSMIPPLVLQPRPGERVLDLCASPGSKTTQMAALMENQGVILAAEVAGKRIRNLVSNLRRMGIVNTAVVQGFGQQYGNQYYETFDRVLVDPPCSALGTLHKSPEVLSWWSPRRTEKLAVNQRQLLHSGLKALKPGGTLVYSTCTITPEENEEVIDFALRSFPVQLEEIRLPQLRVEPGLTRYAGKTYHSDLHRTVRIDPTENGSEAFFVAHLRKMEGFGQRRLRKPVNRIEEEWLRPSQSPVKAHLERIGDDFDLPAGTFHPYSFLSRSSLSCCCREMSSFPFFESPRLAGLPLLSFHSGRPRLTTDGTHLVGGQARENKIVLRDLDDLQRFVNRESLERNRPDCKQVLIHYESFPIGHSLVQDQQVLSRFPRSGHIFQILSSSSKDGGPEPPLSRA